MANHTEIEKKQRKTLKHQIIANYTPQIATLQLDFPFQQSGCENSTTGSLGLEKKGRKGVVVISKKFDFPALKFPRGISY